MDIESRLKKTVLPLKLQLKSIKNASKQSLSRPILRHTGSKIPGSNRIPRRGGVFVWANENLPLMKGLVILDLRDQKHRRELIGEKLPLENAGRKNKYATYR